MNSEGFQSKLVLNSRRLKDLCGQQLVRPTARPEYLGGSGSNIGAGPPEEKPATA